MLDKKTDATNKPSLLQKLLERRKSADNIKIYRKNICSRIEFGTKAALLIYSDAISKCKDLEFGSEEAVDKFYETLEAVLDKEVFRHMRAEDVKTAAPLLHDTLRKNDFTRRYESNFLPDNIKREPPFRNLPLSPRQMGGLVLSYLINVSDHIKKIKFDSEDVIALDYVGAFANKSKTIVINGGTGSNYGYKRNETARVFSTHPFKDKLTRMDALFDGVSDSFRYYAKRLITVISGYVALIISISDMQGTGFIPLISLPGESTLPGGKRTPIQLHMFLSDLMNEPLYYQIQIKFNLPPPPGYLSDVTLNSIFTTAIFAGMGYMFLSQAIKNYRFNRLLSVDTVKLNDEYKKIYESTVRSH